MTTHRPARLQHEPSRTRLASSGSAPRRIEIGLINNIGDKALRTTERQFETLIADAATDFDLRFRVFALKETPRSPCAREYIAAHYEPASAVLRAELHALIFTGAQPQADRLDHEPYWDELVELIDWAKANTASTILSCLSAHAAVQHLDGIQRRPLAEKCTGVFAFAAKRTHALVGQKGGSTLIPHSRYNGLLESELDEAGYCTLSASPTHGVDTFTKNFGSDFVFLQGHPEYEAGSLARSTGGMWNATCAAKRKGSRRCRGTISARRRTRNLARSSVGSARTATACGLMS